MIEKDVNFIKKIVIMNKNLININYYIKKREHDLKCNII